jgi:hypothetical protein
MKGVFYYVDSVCYAAERAGASGMIPLLEQLHAYAPLHSKTTYEGFQPDYIQERLAYLELVIGRALARCGNAEGFIILTSYLNDSRALLAEHAHTELVAITREDHGKDVREWSRWLEFNGENLASAPYRKPTEPMQVWDEAILTK